MQSVMIVAPTSMEFHSPWNAVSVTHSGVYHEQKNASASAAYLYARQKLAAWQNFACIHHPIDEIITGRSLAEINDALDSTLSPTTNGRGMAIICKVGLPHAAEMWCTVNLGPDGEILQYRKIGTTPLRGREDETAAKLRSIHCWKPDEFFIRHDIEAKDFVPDVMALYAKATLPRPTPSIELARTPDEQKRHEDGIRRKQAQRRNEGMKQRAASQEAA